MGEAENPPPLAVPVEEKNWTIRVVAGLVLLGLVAFSIFFALTVVPRWWSHRVGDMVNGSMTRGTVIGLLVGLVFTLGALVMLRQVLRDVPWRLRIGIVVAALVIAAPNLMTLGIVIGNGNAAHAGERVLDVDAPGFRTASAWGAALGVIAAIALWYWVWKWQRDRERERAVQAAKDTDARAEKKTDPS